MFSFKLSVQSETNTKHHRVSSGSLSHGFCFHSLWSVHSKKTSLPVDSHSSKVSLEKILIMQRSILRKQRKFQPLDMYMFLPALVLLVTQPRVLSLHPAQLFGVIRYTPFNMRWRLEGGGGRCTSHASLTK